MLFYRYSSPHKTNDPFRIDQESGADNALNFLAVHHFFPKGPQGFEELCVRVGQQGKGQLKLGSKLLMTRMAVSTNSQHLNLHSLEL